MPQPKLSKLESISANRLIIWGFIVLALFPEASLTRESLSLLLGESHLRIFLLTGEHLKVVQADS